MGHSEDSDESSFTIKDPAFLKKCLLLTSFHAQCFTHKNRVVDFRANLKSNILHNLMQYHDKLEYVLWRILSYYLKGYHKIYKADWAVAILC